MASLTMIRRATARRFFQGQLRSTCKPNISPLFGTTTFDLHTTGSHWKREKSTVAEPAKCPVNHGGKTAAEIPEKTSHHPTLKHVPSLPIIGSFLPQYSKIPSLAEPYEFWKKLRETYGDYYTIGFPSLGNPDDIRSTLHVIHDPAEMAKVVRSGGSFPSGLVQSLWANKKWAKQAGMLTVSTDNDGLFGQGPEWKRLRTFMQTDLLHPASAKGYVPGIMEAARLASQGAPASNTELNRYLNRCSFDMFCALMFGELTETADETTPTDPENIRFVEAAVQALSTAILMLLSPYQAIMGNFLNIETKEYKHMSEGFDITWEVGRKKIQRFMGQLERGELTEKQQNSYLARAVERQAQEGSNVSLEEAQELAWNGLFAAVDTTSAVLAWNLMHIARLPDMQERLYQELVRAVGSVGTDGKLNAKVLERSNTPYLHAIIRESQRMTPGGPISVFKRLCAGDVTIHGEVLPNGSVVALEAHSLLMDPELVENPNEFKPERWFADAVEARKGTPSEIMDHAYFRDPFSQGARRCPGSRVATNEILVMLSTLVLDWKITSPVTDMKDIKFEQGTSVEVKLPALEFEPRA